MTIAESMMNLLETQCTFANGIHTNLTSSEDVGFLDKSAAPGGGVQSHMKHVIKQYQIILSVLTKIVIVHQDYVPVPSRYGMFTYIWIHLVVFYCKCR